LREAKEKLDTYERARMALARQQQAQVQVGKLGVDLSVQMNNLRNQSRLEYTALREAFGRNCLEVGGVWIDEGFTPKTEVLTIKAMSDAYFRILELQPRIREVYQLSNYVVWITPSGTALVIDAGEGKEKLGDDQIKALFTARK